MQILASLDLTWLDWLATALCGVLIGMGKAGVTGTGLMIVPIMAHVFGGKVSTGIVLPMLIIADVFAVIYYHRHAEWKYITRLLPWTLAGILAAVFTGHAISDELFRQFMAIAIILSICVMILRDLQGQRFRIPDSRWIAFFWGILGGFATMIGNAAGPIMAVYLLAMRLPKLHFIGTAAWFFFIINVFKVPFHLFAWNTISAPTLLLDLALAPAIIGGVFLGIKLVKVIPEGGYRWLVIVTTLISAVFLF